MPRRRRYRRNDASGTAEMLLGVAVAGGALYLAYKIFGIAEAIPGAVADIPQDVGTTAAAYPSALGDVVNPPAGTSMSDYLSNLGSVVGSVFGGPPVVINTPQGDVSTDPLLNTDAGYSP